MPVGSLGLLTTALFFLVITYTKVWYRERTNHRRYGLVYKAYLGKWHSTWHLKDEGRLGQKSGRWGLTPGRKARCVQRSRGTKLASLLVLYILGQSHVYSSCQVTALGWRQLPEGRKGGVDAFICRDAQSAQRGKIRGLREQKNKSAQWDLVFYFSSLWPTFLN